MTTLAVFDVLFRADMTNFTGGLAAGAKSMTSINSGLSGLTSSLLKANLILDAGRAIWDTASNSVIGMNAKIETATAQFTTLDGSVTKAQAHVSSLFQFAAETPFPVQQIIAASLKLQLFGGNALDTAANLKLVTDAAAATNAPIANVAFQIGRVYAAMQGGEPFSRATLALQRMGVLQPQIALQLDNMLKAGAPVSEMWKVFTDNLNRFGDAALRQTSTWSGLVNVIKNFIGLDVATATRPLFDEAKLVATALVNMLSSPEFQNAVQTFAKYLDQALAVVQLLGQGALSMVPDLVNGFKVVGSVVLDAWNALITFNTQLTKGGVAAIAAYANGIIQGAQSYLHAAIEYVTTFISGFLIGQSPPPYGPLADITVGGQKVIEAWVKGALSADLSPILAIPKFVSNSWTAVHTAATSVKDYIQTIADGVTSVNSQLDALAQKANAVKQPFEDQATAVKDQLDRINSAEATVNQAMDTVNAQIQQVTDSFQAQIDPIQEQIDALQDVLSVQDKLKTNALQMQQNLLEQQRAQIEIAGGDTSAIDAKLKIMDAQVQLNDLQNKQKQLVANTSLIPLTAQVENLKDQQTKALDPLKEQLRVLTSQKDLMNVQKSILTQQLAAIKANEAAALKPITDQEKLLKEQKTDLQEQEKVWRQILSHVDELQSTLKKPKATKALTTSAVPGSGSNSALTDAANKLAEKLAAAAHAAALKAAKGFVNGFVGWIKQNLPLAISVLVGLITGGPVGAVIGLVRGEIWNQIFNFAHVKFDIHSLAGQIGSALGAVIGFIFGGPLGATIGIGLGNLIGQLISTGMSNLGKPGGASKLGGQARGIADTLISLVGSGVQIAQKWLQNTGIPMLWQGIQDLGGGIQRFLQGVDWNGVLTTFINSFTQILKGIYTWASTTGLSILGGIASTLFSGLSKVDWGTIASQLFNAWLKLESTFLDMLVSTGKILLNAGQQMWGMLVTAIQKVDWSKVVNEALKLGGQFVGSIIDTLAGSNGHKGLITQLTDWIGTVDWSNVIIKAVQQAVNIGAGLIQGIINALLGSNGQPGLLASIINFITGIDWVHIASVMRQSVWNVGVAFMTGIMNVIIGTDKSPGLLPQLVNWITGPFLTGLEGLAGKLLTAGGNLGSALARGIANAFIGLIELMINTFINAIDAIQIHFGGLDTPFGKMAAFDWGGLAIPDVSLPRFASGGIVPGSIGQPQLILAHGGENVQTVAQQNTDTGGGTLIVQMDGTQVMKIIDRRLTIARRIYNPVSAMGTHTRRNG